MTEHPPVSPPSRPAESGADATEASVTVRLTESVARGDPLVGALHGTDARVEFPSVAAAYAFEDRINDAAADHHDYQLTPDHRSDATFFLRCQRVDR